jgi:prephenate dehydrogenase
MKINIIGDGSFGTFLKELLPPVFDIDNGADTIILAVPISAYESVAAANSDRHLINVCSVQRPSTEMATRHTPNVTGIHPLFGQRTPADRRNSILTRQLSPESPFAESEREFLDGFGKITNIIRTDHNGVAFTPDSHDQLMARTHVAAVLAAKQMKVFVERAEDIPDEFLPNSFRLMRDFVRTLDDMPQGTIESIMANPYF